MPQRVAKYTKLALSICLMFAACRANVEPIEPAPSVYRTVFTEGADAWVRHHAGDPNTVTVVGLRANISSTVASANTREMCDMTWSKLSAAPAGAALALQTEKAVQSPQAPARVSNIQTERAQWRIEELTGVVAGTTPSPAALRSIIKTRRDNAPPYFVLSGDNGCVGVIAVVDSTLRNVLTHVKLELPGPKCAPLVVHPSTDLDQDGQTEWLVRSGREWDGHGLFRGVYRLETTPETRLHAVWSARYEGDCATSNIEGLP